MCQIASGGKLAIWGSLQTRANIDTVLASGVPCIPGVSVQRLIHRRRNVG